MRCLLAAAAAACLAAAEASSSPPASSRSSIRPSDFLLRADDVLSLPYASPVNPPRLLLPRPDGGQDGIIVARQTTVNLDSSSTLNMSAWDSETRAACTKALSNLVRSTNPSGTCVCYNIISLSATGGFEADLRLYNTSEPRGGFANVPPTNISVGVLYNGASVNPISQNELRTMSLPTNKGTRALAARAERKEPQLLQTYMFVGQIDKDRMAQNMSMAALEAILMPTLTLTARNTSGAAASTNVSLNEACFLTGVFSKQVVMSDFSAAQAAVDAKLDALRNGTVTFVLPGVQIMIFPIGLVITSVWLLLGLVAYGIGTYERAVYADMYRRRRAAATGAPVKTM